MFLNFYIAWQKIHYEWCPFEIVEKLLEKLIIMDYLLYLKIDYIIDSLKCII
jgi:hypothetical protein